MTLKWPAGAMAFKRPSADTERDGEAKGLARLAFIEPGEAMGRNAAQAIVDRLKAIQKAQPDHPGLEIYKGLKTNEQKREFGMQLHIDRDGDQVFKTFGTFRNMTKLIKFIKQLQTQMYKRISDIYVKLAGAFCDAWEKDGVKRNEQKKVTQGWMALWEVASLEGIPWNPKDELTMQILTGMVPTG